MKGGRRGGRRNAGYQRRTLGGKVWVERREKKRVSERRNEEIRSKGKSKKRKEK